MHFIALHWWQILITCGLTALSGWAYHYGGSKGGLRWARQVIDAACTISCLTAWYGWNWYGILIFGTIWITSTYFKIKGHTNLFTWMLVGLSFGLVPLPYMFNHPHDIHWLGFFIRTGFLTVSVGIVVRFFGGPVGFSEGFRGGVQIITLPLLLIGRATK